MYCNVSQVICKEVYRPNYLEQGLTVTKIITKIIVCIKQTDKFKQNKFFTQFLYQNYRTKLVAMYILVKSMTQKLKVN